MTTLKNTTHTGLDMVATLTVSLDTHVPEAKEGYERLPKLLQHRRQRALPGRPSAQHSNSGVGGGGIRIVLSLSL